jgi:Reverse transcriptase (RNA-dependent DNA polymerase)
MPNGIQIAPAIFSQLVNFLFGQMLWHEVLAFMDDLIIPSKSTDDGTEILARVFERIARSELKLKPSKSKFFKQKLTFWVL